jgi:uncharacterized protein YbjT (DUF2867 family)
MSIIKFYNTMHILIIGSNGNVGKRLVKHLVQKHYKVRSMVREKDQFGEMVKLGAAPVLGDLEHDFSEALATIDGIVFTAGSGSKTGPDKTISVDQQGAIKSIDEAINHGIKRYIMVSAQGARDPEHVSRIQHYYRAKNIADEYLIQSGLDYTIFRPGRLTNDEGTGTITASDNYLKNGTTIREDLAYAIAESIDMKNTYRKIIELVEGNVPVVEALKAI